MADREFYIGDRGPYFVDDASVEFSDPGQVIQRRELNAAMDTTGVVGILKGDGTQVTAATPGVDYVIPWSAISATIVLAKITIAGTNGSLTFTNGLLTAKTDPT